MSKPSNTNSPKTFSVEINLVNISASVRLFMMILTTFGGYSNRVTPLPIPNREVKTICADGTAFSGRVGHCRSLNPDLWSGFFLCFF